MNNYTITLNGKEFTVNPLPLSRLGEVISNLTDLVQKAGIDENTNQGALIANIAGVITTNLDEYSSLVSGLMNNDEVTAEDVKNSKPYELLDMIQALLEVNEWDKIRSRFLSISQILNQNQENGSN